jgi:hypothetical protein
LCESRFGSINKEPFLYAGLLTQSPALQMNLGDPQRA